MKKILRGQIWSDFSKLVDTGASEELLHQYLVRYPALLPVWRPLDNVVYSKFRLGSQHVTDFAFVRDDSPGLRWHFIEIERPDVPLLTKNGDPTAKLSHALRQLHDWHIWFANNRAYVASTFPHGDRIPKAGLADPHLTLVIGRRAEDWWGQREKLMRIAGGVEIRTFDGLEHNLRSPAYDDDFPFSCYGYSENGSKLLSTMKIEVSFYVDDSTP